jgi:hypothetical protein
MDGQIASSVVGGFTYTMRKSGPEVRPDEVESHLLAIEVMILWDSNVVHVSHLTPPRSFHVGEEVGGKFGCDYFIPGETLGTTRAPIVICDGPRAALVVLPRSRGHVDVPGHRRVSFAELISSGRARPSAEMSGAYEYELASNARARMELEGSSLVFEVGAMNAGKRVPAGLLATTEPDAVLYTGLSFLMHAGLVTAFAFFMPTMQGDDGETLHRDRVLMIQKLLDASAEREREERDPQEVTETARDREGGTGAAAKGEAGSMGDPTTQQTGHRYGVRGPTDNPDPHVAKLAALQDASTFGIIGFLSTMAGGDPNAPTAPWGRQESLGRDAKSARGTMFGDTIDESLGAGGLDLTGVGERGGGRAESIGLGEFDFGHGSGSGPDQGIGVGQGRPGGGHQGKAPQMRELVASINGRLRPEVIQRIVRQNFGRFRYCYENGMRNGPNLQGRVTVKFVIGRDGAVAMAGDGGSDLPDQGVVNCVVRGFSNLTFPEPEGGMVTVVYPILFTPGQ